MKDLFSLILVSLFFFSCSSSQKVNSDEFTCVEKLVFPIDENTYFFSKAISSFVDEQSGKEYLSFENSEKGEPAILFYDMQSQEQIKRIDIQRTGPNAISMFGHHVVDPDHIFVTALGRPTLYLINGEGTILKSYDYAETDDTEPLSTIYSVSIIHMPLLINGSSIHLPQCMIQGEMSGSDWLSTPMAATIDTVTKEIKNLPLKYPLLFNKKSKITASTDISYSFDSDGKNFVYAFMKSDSLIVTSDHVTSQKYAAKSRYLSNVKCIPYSGDDFLTTQRAVCEQEMYCHLIYDQYRDVYYRFALFPCDSNTYIDLIELNRYRQEFSVMVLSKNFELIKEVKFPRDKYFPKMCFVGKKGLYISENNPNNPEFDENKLVFSCFR